MVFPYDFKCGTELTFGIESGDVDDVFGDGDGAGAVCLGEFDFVVVAAGGNGAIVPDIVEVDMFLTKDI